MNGLDCWYRVDIDTSEAIKENFRFPIRSHHTVDIWKYEPTEIFKESWLAYMRSLELDCSTAMVFYKNYRGLEPRAHVDISRDGKISNFSFNWVISGTNSSMIWYKTPLENTKIVISPAGTGSQEWTTDKLEEITRYNIDSRMTLTRVNLPHAIWVGDEPRLCVSIRTRLCNVTTTWAGIVDIMREKRLLIEN